MRPNPTTQASRAGNLVKHQVLKRLESRRGASRVPVSAFEEALARHGADADEVFVHVGLSDVKAAFDTDPYEFLLDRLEASFESIIAPGFTDYFRTSGVYHKTYSRPKHGTFVRLFHEDADYRTDDAIKSMLVRGPHRFDDCDHHDSYGEDGCFAELVRDGTLVMDVGTPWLTCSHLHYLEYKYDVPYMTAETYEGVMYRSPTEYERIEQTCGVTTSSYYSWNKPKITRRLERANVVDRYDLNGLKVLFFRLDDLDDVLGRELREDPYYLVTL